jgi:hypothetical protein
MSGGRSSRGKPSRANTRPRPANAAFARGGFSISFTSSSYPRLHPILKKSQKKKNPSPEKWDVLLIIEENALKFLGLRVGFVIHKINGNLQPFWRLVNLNG